MMTMDFAPAAWRLLVASTCLLAVGACTHASPPRPAPDAAPLRFTHATAQDIVVDGDEAVRQHFLHFELINTWTRSVKLHGTRSEAGFLVTQQSASFLRERADGEWGDVEGVFVEPAPARDKVSVPRNGQVQVVVQWVGNEVLEGEPLRACLALSEERRICSGPFVVEGVPGA